MNVKDLGEKLAALCEAAKIKVLKFKKDFSVEQETNPRAIEKWLKSASYDLRDPSPGRLLEYWASRNLSFDAPDYAISGIEFRKKLGLPCDLVAQPGAESLLDFCRDLAGLYQLIRPHTTNSNAYVLEPMEMKISGDGMALLSYSHNTLEKHNIYTGDALVNGRYLMCLLSRTHEHENSRQAFRSLSFYIGEGRFDGCLSGVMLRGMRGIQGGKNAVALPFVAIPVEETSGLTDINPIEVESSSKKTPQRLRRIHRDSSVLVGELHRRWYPDLFSICNGIFTHPNFVGPSTGLNRFVVHSVPPSLLQDIENADQIVWKAAVAELQSVEPTVE
jgi:hypothetical protein